jgi:hypothetical protein
MTSKITMADGREITIALSGKRVVEAFVRSATERATFTQLTTTSKAKVWVSAAHVAVIEDRPDSAS